MKRRLINIIVLLAGVVCGMVVMKEFNIFSDVTNNFIATSSDESYLSEKQDNVLNNNLVLVESVYDGFVIDLKYATEDNITGTVLYNRNLCYLQKNTLDKLIQVNEELRLLGYRIKIWDAYRPLYVQKKLWATYPNASYIANPFLRGSNHNRGAAVDITLVDLNGNEVAMPSKFDEFGKKSRRGYVSSEAANKNLSLLTDTMQKYGFNIIESEWWHYDDKDCNEYPVMDYSFMELIKK